MGIFLGITKKRPAGSVKCDGLGTVRLKRGTYLEKSLGKVRGRCYIIGGRKKELLAGRNIIRNAMIDRKRWDWPRLEHGEARGRVAQ